MDIEGRDRETAKDQTDRSRVNRADLIGDYGCTVFQKRLVTISMVQGQLQCDVSCYGSGLRSEEPIIVRAITYP